VTAAELASFSHVATYSAMAVYTIAFVAYALDLAKRSGDAQLRAARDGDASAQESRGGSAPAVATSGAARSAASSGSGSTVVLERTAAPADGPAPQRGSTFQRVGTAMVLLGLVVHLAAVVTRGVAAERVPWANMFEFALTGTAIIVGVFLVVRLFVDLGYLGAYVTGLTLVLLGIATVNYYVDVVPLPPALQSAWLVIHVLVAIVATAFFALAAGLSALQLVQAKREQAQLAGLRFMSTLPGAARLEDLAYRVALVGFVLWTFTLVAGAVWAERAWGRYWGWDTKEVWTFIIWVLYAGYIHARATRGWRGSRSSWLSIVGFAAVLFNFGVVNVFFKGLHAYSGL